VRTTRLEVVLAGPVLYGRVRVAFHDNDYRDRIGWNLLGSIHDRLLGVAGLAIFAVCTALSMTLLTTGFGRALASAPVRASFDRLAPVLAMLSLAFGSWYALGALDLAPYFL